MIQFIKDLFVKSNTYYVSDLHLNHRNVIPYCNRPWISMDEMNEAIIKIWNDTVKPNDTVYYLGDFSLNSKRDLPKFTSRLNGKKHFISGNHDWTHPAMVKSNDKYQKRVDLMLEWGWESVQTELQVTLKNGYKILLNHFPYLDNTEEYDLRYKELRPKNQGQWLIHGHLHGRYRKKDRMIDVAFDGDLKLWSEDEIIALMKDKRTFIETPISEFYRQRERRVLE